MEGSTIDFTKLNNPNSEASKYLVKDNDVIIIPSKDSSVYVFGQVLSHGHIHSFLVKNINIISKKQMALVIMLKKVML